MSTSASRGSEQKPTDETVEDLVQLAEELDETRRRRYGSFDGEIIPNLGEVGFGRVGQAEGERSANSFLPLAIILSASKS